MFNAAVIGVGNMGKHHARVYNELPDTKLIAVADLSDDLLKEAKEKFGCTVYNDYKEMLEKEKIDVISIVVPTKLHKKVALDIISKKIPFLLEKPISDKIEDAESIVNEAKKNNVKFLIGHIERFNPAVRKLKELIDQKRVGDITTISAKRVGLFPPQIKDTNIIIDVSIHDIEIINFLMGKAPEKICVNGGKALTAEREDFVDILLGYGQATGTVQSNWITPIKIRTLTVTGTKGYAELDYIKQELTLYESKYTKGMDSFGEFVKFGQPNKINIEIEQQEPLKLEIMDLIESIKEDKTPYVTGDHAISALKVALKANNMMKEA